MKRITVFVFGMMAFFSSCKKQYSQIPYAKVDIYIYPSQPLYSALNIVGGWVYVAGGVKGIIVYRSSSSQFYAYERACPYDPNADCSKVEVTNDNITLVDSCCNSKFLITQGDVISGPATQQLLKYQNSFDGNLLHIFN